MNGIELTDILINDLEKSISAKKSAMKCEVLRTEIKKQQPRLFLQKTSEEMWVALTYDISLPGYLTDLLQYVNQFGEIIANTRDITFYLEQLRQNRERVADAFDKISNPRYIYSSGQSVQPLFSVLQSHLNLIHQEASSLEACYNKLTEKMNAGTPFQ